ncbi:MAG: GAF domain-containing sensor histidine kinase [Solirubrobacterales bacterium]|nr:GAF domain-containing sensor histidine kinase [Solirubrobacterales bacterium]
MSTEAAGLEREQLERLLEVGRSLVADLDLDTVLMNVLDAARQLTGARYAALGVLDADKTELERFLYVGIDEETRKRIGPLPRGHGILGELITDPRPLRLDSLGDHPRSYGFPSEHPKMTTFVGTPITVRGEVFGNIYLTEKEGGSPFEEGDEHLLTVLAEWAAVAVNNARTHEKLRRGRADLERLVQGLQATASLSRELGGESDLGRVLELVTKRARALVEARSSYVLLNEGAEQVVRGAAGECGARTVGGSFGPGSAPADFIGMEASQRIGPAGAESLREIGIEASAGLAVPLRSRGQGLGVLVVVDHLGEDPSFSADQQLTLESFATSAANAIAAVHAIEDEKAKLAIASSERERGRWARELHDETLQELGALRIMQENAARAGSLEQARDYLAQANEQVERTVAGLQGLIAELRPAALDQLGVPAAIDALIERLASRSELTFETDIDLAFERGDAATRHEPELESTIYRLVQESLTNAIKHADATRARVAIEERDGLITVRVEDDGNGFDLGSVSRGFGLTGMRERVELAGGELTVEGREGGGTLIRVSLPTNRADGG